MALKYWLVGGFVALMLGNRQRASAAGRYGLAHAGQMVLAQQKGSPTALRTATAPTTPPATPIATPSVPSPVAKTPTPKSETIPSATCVTKGSGQLPSDHGQVCVSTISRRTLRKSPRPRSRSKRLSIGSSARPAPTLGSPARFVCSMPIAIRSAFITRRRCNAGLPISSIALW